MDVFKCFPRRVKRSSSMPTSNPYIFKLPVASPRWTPGTGFATGSITLGEIEVRQVSNFTKIWSSKGGNNDKGATFYQPAEIPSGYFTLGHYSQPNGKPLHGWVLIAKENVVSLDDPDAQQGQKAVWGERSLPPLEKPLEYNLVWNNQSWNGRADGDSYFWIPIPPKGYKAVGYVVTNTPQKPSLEEVRCVRSDLTDICETGSLIWHIDSNNPKVSFSVSNMRPRIRGMQAQGISVGTFHCNSDPNSEESLPVACLKNPNLTLISMPNLSQVHTIVQNYGPTLLLHPDEIYFPSSVSWFFENGAVLHSRDVAAPVPIPIDGSNLPQGGSNDGEYWLDLPEDETMARKLKHGNLDSAEGYVHIKPMLGGTFTDIVFWVFYPFNGPATAKVRSVNLPLGKIGEHVGDWEHVTLRVSNFTGELCQVYFSEHSAGKWVDASDLEYIEGNKPLVYSSKNGHANFPHAGLFLQGNSKIGIRNDSAQSTYTLDMSRKYQLVAAEYLQSVGSNEILPEPPWLNYSREWGPKITYNRRNELNKAEKLLPAKLRSSLMHLHLPNEISGEEGPTGPKMKSSWSGDEKSKEG